MLNPKRETIKVLAPNVAKTSSILDCIPSTVETIAITEVTPMTIPSTVKNDRSLLAQRAAKDSMIKDKNTILIFHFN